jgi:hypothetical protein
MKKLVDLMKENGRGDLPALIYADRPACHDSVDILKYLYEENVHLTWFVSNSSQIMQPLDGAPYANLKKNLKSAKDNEILKRTLTGESTDQVVAELIPIIERKSFTKEVSSCVIFFSLRL